MIAKIKAYWAVAVSLLDAFLLAIIVWSFNRNKELKEETASAKAGQEEVKTQVEEAKVDEDATQAVVDYYAAREQYLRASVSDPTPKAPVLPAGDKLL